MPARSRHLLAWVQVAGFLVLDQLTKWLVRGHFSLGEGFPLINGIIHITYVQNTGAAFGILKGGQPLFIFFSSLVIVWMTWEILHSESFPWPSALILTGALGNLIDRLRFGYVVDFLDLRVWPVFNVADSALTIGVIALLWQSWRLGRN